MNSVSRKRVLVTGARGCLGSHVAKRFAEGNCDVTGLDHSGGETAASDSIRWLHVNLTDSQAIKSALAGLEFDVLVHCAGGFRFAQTEQLTDEDLNFLMDVNLRSAFYLARELIPGMKKRNFGRIAFISARMTLQSGAGMGAYSASKAGLNMLTTSLAEEVKSFNITVNAVLPTVIDTPANRRDMPEADFSKWVRPEQLAEILFSLASPWGDPIHGALLPVSGRL